MERSFRDDVRDFWRGDAAATALAPRLCASPDMFNHRGRRPWACVNFITAHDGFTLNDLVSYNDKHNEANGEDNQDGSSDNRSWNCGAEGPTDDPDINGARAPDAQPPGDALFSQGTPMVCWLATSSGAPRTATTMRIARITRSAGSIGSLRASVGRCRLLPSS